MKYSLSILLTTLLINGNFAQKGVQKFPNNFLFGVGTSAYQVEGGWSSAGKGESILDHLTHRRPELFDKSNGDIACDSYHLFKRDVEMVTELGVQFYHFSISWSRLLPSGFSDRVSRDGVRYYNSLIDELLASNISSYITLYHWDLPQPLQDLGGWNNPLIIDYFLDYAKVVFSNFGDRVKTWITFNEPSMFCNIGDTVNMKEFLVAGNVPGVSEYLCSHHVLLAHARTWHLYNDTFREDQKGRIGIGLHAPWVEPLSNSTRDEEVAEEAMQFLLGRFADPVMFGDYPDIVKETVGNRSVYQGFSLSRLPSFSDRETQLLRGSADFLAINHLEWMTYSYKETPGERPHFAEPSLDDDLGFKQIKLDSWKDVTSESFQMISSGISKVLRWIQVRYDNPEVLITQSGIQTATGLIDLDRVTHLQWTLAALLRALQDECNVTAYSYWTLMDNFHWNKGYQDRYGLYEVNFESARRTRSPRISALVYKNIIDTKTVNPFFSPKIPDGFISSAGRPSLTPHILIIFLVLVFFKLKWNDY